MAADDPPLHAVGDGGLGQHLQRLELGAVHVVGVHLHAHVELGGEIEERLDVRALVCDGGLHLRQPADRRSTHGKRLAQQSRRLRVRHDPFLWEGHEGHVDHAGEAVARPHHALEGDQLGREVHVDLRMQAADTVRRGEPEGGARPLLHVGDGEVNLDLAGAVEGLLRPARAEQVAAQHLVDVEMGIDEGGRDQPAARVYTARGRAVECRTNLLDAPVANADGDRLGIVEPDCVVNEKVPVGTRSRVRHVSSAVMILAGAVPSLSVDRRGGDDRRAAISGRGVRRCATPAPGLRPAPIG